LVQNPYPAVIKTTIDIPDSTLHRARNLAAAQGISMHQLVSDALEEKLRRTSGRPAVAEPAWMKLAGAFGKTPAARAETRRIQKIIDAEFEQVDLEDQQ
jgi:hypothetical protein